MNDLKKKVIGRFYKEITIDGHEGEDITYVFPDTEEFIRVLKRKFVTQKLISKEKVKA